MAYIYLNVLRKIQTSNTWSINTGYKPIVQFKLSLWFRVINHISCLSKTTLYVPLTYIDADIGRISLVYILLTILSVALPLSITTFALTSQKLHKRPIFALFLSNVFSPICNKLFPIQFLFIFNLFFIHFYLLNGCFLNSFITFLCQNFEINVVSWGGLSFWRRTVVIGSGLVSLWQCVS